MPSTFPGRFAVQDPPNQKAPDRQVSVAGIAAAVVAVEIELAVVVYALVLQSGFLGIVAVVGFLAVCGLIRTVT